MAYLRISFDKQEIDRRDLAGPVVIGRAADCEVGVRDILLSRRHCRVEIGNDGIWRGMDLASRNGTLLNDQPLTDAVPLCDGDVIRLGRVRVLFATGNLAQVGLSAMRCPLIRATDPTESLCATHVGFRYLEPGHDESKTAGPAPHPLPRMPAAFARDDVYSLLNAIASSSWDSIYAQARKPLLSHSGDATATLPRPLSRPRSPIDLSPRLPAIPQAKIPVPQIVNVATPPPERSRRAVAAILATLFALIAITCWLSAAPNPAAHAAAPAKNRPAVTVNPTPAPLDPRWTAACQVVSAALPFIL